MTPDTADTASLVAAAHPYYRLVPVGAGSKVCLARWNLREFTLGELLAHVRRGGNIAARVGETRSAVRVLVVDEDARTPATEVFIARHGLEGANMQVETASGNRHRWFRLPAEAGTLATRIRLRVAGRRLPVDIKATGYVLLPGSRVGGGVYRFCAGTRLRQPENLVEAPGYLLDLIRREPMPERKTTPAPPTGDGIERVRRSIRRIVAVSGQGGHNVTFHVACRLAAAGLTEEQVFRELTGWNETNAEPPWTVAELRHKARDAVRRVTGGA